MSDMADVFNDWKKIKQQKRASNREHSAAFLRSEGIAFVSLNDGAHLRVSAGSELIDFWPGTGLWKVQGASQSKRGVYRLVAYLKGKK